MQRWGRGLPAVALLALVTAQAAAQPAATPPDSPEATANAVCPVLPGEPIDPAVWVEFEGRRVYLCCRKCQRQFEADPASFREAVAQVMPSVDEVVRVIPPRLPQGNPAMKQWTHVLTFAGLFAAALFAAGCSSTKSTTSHDTHGATRGMMCPKCQTVWVADTTASPPRYVTRLSRSAEMTCPDCDAMAASRLLADGRVMLHECPTCKVTPIEVKPHEHPERSVPR